MRALMISPAMPSMTGGGLSMRAGLFLHALTRIAETDVLVVPLGGLGLHRELDTKFNAKSCGIIGPDGRHGLGESVARRLREFLKDPLRIFQRQGPLLAEFLGDDLLDAVAAATAGQSYDLIHISRPYMAAAGLRVSGSPFLTLDADENDAAVFRRSAKALREAGDSRLADQASKQAEACARLQENMLRKFDLVFASSQLEANSLRPYADAPLVVVPNTVEKPKTAQRQDDGSTLIFVGTLGYPPNANGIKWFVKEVWPKVLAKAAGRPRLLIIGRDCPRTVRKLASSPGVSIHEDVPHLNEFYRKATFSVVPLWVGGGTRLKIVEAALFGVPVISTPLGAEGLPFQNGSEITLASDADTMAVSILTGLSDREGSIQMGERAKARAHAELDFKKVSEQLSAQWLDLLERPHKSKL